MKPKPEECYFCHQPIRPDGQYCVIQTKAGLRFKGHQVCLDKALGRELVH